MLAYKALCLSRRPCNPPSFSWKSTQLLNRQFAQQRLEKGAVIGGWVSSFYLLLPIGVTPFLGVWLDFFGQRVTICKIHAHFIKCFSIDCNNSIRVRDYFLNIHAVAQVQSLCSHLHRGIYFLCVSSGLFIDSLQMILLTSDNRKCVTPAPQVEIIRNVIPDPRFFATAFAIKSALFSFEVNDDYGNDIQSLLCRVPS